MAGTEAPAKRQKTAKALGKRPQHATHKPINKPQPPNFTGQTPEDYTVEQLKTDKKPCSDCRINKALHLFIRDIEGNMQIHHRCFQCSFLNFYVGALLKVVLEDKDNPPLIGFAARLKTMLNLVPYLNEWAVTVKKFQVDVGANELWRLAWLGVKRVEKKYIELKVQLPEEPNDTKPIFFYFDVKPNQTTLQRQLEAAPIYKLHQFTDDPTTDDNGAATQTSNKRKASITWPDTQLLSSQPTLPSYPSSSSSTITGWVDYRDPRQTALGVKASVGQSGGGERQQGSSSTPGSKQSKRQHDHESQLPSSQPNILSQQSWSNTKGRFDNNVPRQTAPEVQAGVGRSGGAERQHGSSSGHNSQSFHHQRFNEHRDKSIEQVLALKLPANELLVVIQSARIRTTKEHEQMKNQYLIREFERRVKFNDLFQKL